MEVFVHPAISYIKFVMDKLGILVHVGSYQIWNDLEDCIKNVFIGMNRFKDNFNNSSIFENTFNVMNVDVHINILKDKTKISNKEKEYILSNLEYLITRNLYVTEYSNIGLDILPFLKQIKFILQNKIHYDYILKIHSKTSYNWRNHVLECLCGTPIHISSILNIFKNNSNVGLISPHGFTFRPYSSKNNIHKILRETFSSKLQITYPHLTSAFLYENVKNIESLYNLFYNSTFDLEYEDITIVAGSMFWMRFEVLKTINLETLDGLKFTDGYKNDLGPEHAIERLIPSIIIKLNMIIYEIIPAPKLFAIYFPQYHPIPENDLFWGEGFTEWTLLKDFKAANIFKPLEVEHGGLGYYNLLDYETRRNQTTIALNAGIYGFMIYHYWFKNSHRVLYKVPELILNDGQPDIKFFFCWANEPWTKRWDGLSNNSSQLLLEQEYGHKKDWIIHFDYLIQFFKHKNYCKYNNMPIFAIYRIGHFEINVIFGMLKLWNSMAIDQGFDGIYVIATIGNFYHIDNHTEQILVNIPEIKACYHFMPLIQISFKFEKHLNIIKSIPVKTQYFGHHTDFDNRPRTGSTHVPDKRNSFQFGSELRDILNNVDVTRWDNILFNFHFITAWNEWNEQAILEPSREHKFEFLDQIKSSLQNLKPKNYDNGKETKKYEMHNKHLAGGIFKNYGYRFFLSYILIIFTITTILLFRKNLKRIFLYFKKYWLGFK